MRTEEHPPALNDSFGPVPTIIPAALHHISPEWISPGARKVVQGLTAAGHDGYLVGGCVRDLLLAKTPTDFDVVTNATPEQVRKVFSRARLIGRRFRLVHVRVGREIIEVSTYRANGTLPELMTDAGRVTRDNTYGTREEDAQRRDFTVNALLYDYRRNIVLDFQDGFADIKERVVRLIGDPATRFREDPVRMLRAVRIAARLDFTLDAATAAAITPLAGQLNDVPAARLLDESLKLFHRGSALPTFQLLNRYGLFEPLFPHAHRCLADPVARKLLEQALVSTDDRIRAGKPVIPPFLFAALLWGPYCERLADHLQSVSPAEAGHLAGQEVFRAQSEWVAIPHRMSAVVAEIWNMQRRLEAPRPRRAAALLANKRFRAAYDFLLLRAAAGEAVSDAAEWWTRYQDGAGAESGSMSVTTPRPAATVRKRSRRRRRARAPGAS